ncbi:MAG: hypothetical protein ABTR27_15100, partial [Candidatus Competibacter phosphatis]
MNTALFDYGFWASRFNILKKTSAKPITVEQNDGQTGGGNGKQKLRLRRGTERWWAMLGSNQRPLPCEGS